MRTERGGTMDSQQEDRTPTGDIIEQRAVLRSGFRVPYICWRQSLVTLQCLQ